MFKFKSLIYKFETWLYQPLKILALCCLFFVISLLSNGTLWKLWSLHQNEIRFGQEISRFKAEAYKLDQQMIMAKDPQFIEHLAKDKMDLVSENDLIFIFPN